jgi:hypothetical protein
LHRLSFLRGRRNLQAAPKDTIPPSIVLLGSGRPGVTPAGELLMQDEVLYGSVWTDPGAVTVWRGGAGLTQGQPMQWFTEADLH